MDLHGKNATIKIGNNEPISVSVTTIPEFLDEWPTSEVGPILKKEFRGTLTLIEGQPCRSGFCEQDIERAVRLLQIRMDLKKLSAGIGELPVKMGMDDSL